MVLKVLSLCTGVGGGELAFEASDFNYTMVGYSEIDKYADSIYQKHFPNHENFGDLTKINAVTLPNFDFLIAGFPCQAFSIAGKRKGFDDTRGTIFFDIARILKVKKPKYFLFENVKNLISHDKGNTFQVIVNTLLDLGYDIRWDILNSKDFGVPQNRERIYIRGVRKECGLTLPDISLTTADLIIGTDVNHDIRMQRELINRKIKARVHQVDVKGLQHEINKKKRSSPYTIKQIAEELGVPSTQVEHYFRTDKSFAIPTPEIWYKLKDLLGITTTEFDKSLTEFEIKEGVYDQSKRTYKDTGISPTITASGEVLVQESKPHVLNKQKGVKVHQGAKIYDTDSISCTQCANGGGWGAKTGLYSVKPLKIATATKKGYDEAYPGDGVRLDHPGSVTGRGRTQPKGVGTLTCSSNWGAVDDKLRVRRLVPLESERLQGFPDNWTQYGVDGEEISDAQRYKCMGNAFTVNVIKYVLNSFYDMEVEDEHQ